MQYQWACGETSQYRCLQPIFCSLISPDEAISLWNGPIVGADWDNEYETGSTDIWASGAGSATFRGETLDLAPVTTAKLNAAERDVADCKSW